MSSVTHKTEHDDSRRICAIVVNEDLQDIRLGELTDYLIQQRYTVKLIKDGIKKAKKLTISQLRTAKELTVTFCYYP